MNGRARLMASIMSCLPLVFVTFGYALGQEQVLFKSSGENTKFTQQLTISVDDAPSHNLRVFEFRITFPDSAPVINGLKLVEEWRRGTSDRSRSVGSEGSDRLYHTYIFENGDKLHAQVTYVLHQTPAGNTLLGIGPITGGTGKLSDLRGVVRVSGIIKPGQQIDSQTQIDYSVGK
jgi:hypothetical protein